MLYEWPVNLSTMSALCIYEAVYGKWIFGVTLCAAFIEQKHSYKNAK